MDDFFTFSGHLDTELVIWVKKLEIWLNLSQGGGGSLFEDGQLSMILFWLTWNMDPSLHCLILCKISNFLTGRGYPMSKWPEKKIKVWLLGLYLGSEFGKRTNLGAKTPNLRFLGLNFSKLSLSLSPLSANFQL